MFHQISLTAVFQMSTTTNPTAGTTDYYYNFKTIPCLLIFLPKSHQITYQQWCLRYVDDNNSHDPRLLTSMVWFKPPNSRSCILRGCEHRWHVKRRGMTWKEEDLGSSSAAELHLLTMLVQVVQTGILLPPPPLSKTGQGCSWCAATYKNNTKWVLESLGGTNPRLDRLKNIYTVVKDV